MELRTSLLAAVVALMGGVACTQTPASPIAPSAAPAAVNEIAVDARRSSEPSIADIAVSNGFTTLVAALGKAGLVQTFQGTKHYTVFAPTNQAFTNAAVALNIPDLVAPAGVDGLDLVAALSPEALTPILLYHVTNGDRNSTSVLAAGSLVMLDGNKAVVSGGAIAGAPISAVDFRARNGIVHVIDGVMLPPAN